MVSDLNGCLSGIRSVRTRSIHRFYVVPLGYEVEEEQPVLVADHVVGMTVLESCHDHLVKEVDDRNEDQGTRSVDPEILTDDSQLVQSMESWDVESHDVCHMMLVTVDEVYLATEIAGPHLGI